MDQILAPAEDRLLGLVVLRLVAALEESGADLAVRQAYWLVYSADLGYLDP
jgi:hypothetical protein